MMTPNQLRELAAKMEARDIKVVSCSVWIFPATKEELAALIKKLGPGEKRFDAGALIFQPKSIPELSVYLSGACERKVVGKRHVAKVTIPAHDEDIVEWDCKKAILGDGEGTDGVAGAKSTGDGDPGDKGGNISDISNTKSDSLGK